MAVNTFLMDCKQQNSHKIRGLALRSLCSLRVQGVAEYMQSAIADGLNDIDPYVKKTAIIGCIKFFHSSKELFKSMLFIHDNTRD
jgi:AP-4 complex subunit beta-1